MYSVTDYSYEGYGSYFFYIYIILNIFFKNYIILLFHTVKKFIHLCLYINLLSLLIFIF